MHIDRYHIKHEWHVRMKGGDTYDPESKHSPEGGGEKGKTL